MSKSEVRWRQHNTDDINDWSGRSSQVFYSPCVHTWQIPELSAGATYKAKVFVGARDSDGNIHYLKSNTVVFPPPSPVPEPPAGLAAAAGDGRVALSWDDPSDSSITGYEYRANHNATSMKLAANGYVLESVTASFMDKAGSPGDIVATLHASASATGTDGKRPNTDNGASLATLTGANPDTAGDYTFTCSGSGCTLAANTTYFVRFNSTTGADNNNEYRWKTVLNAFGETPTPADSGWTLADELDYRAGATPWAAATDLAAYLKITAIITPPSDS